MNGDWVRPFDNRKSREWLLSDLAFQKSMYRSCVQCMRSRSTLSRSYFWMYARHAEGWRQQIARTRRALEKR